MGPDEVVVTGIGMVTPLGVNAKTTRDAWLGGKTPERRNVEEFAGTPLGRQEVAALPAFDAAELLGSRRMLKYMSRAATLGCIAAHEAARDAAVSERFAPERVGLFAGTGLASTEIPEVIPLVQRSIDEDGRFSARLLGERGLSAANPLMSFRILANIPPCLVSIVENIRGPNFIFTPWEGQAAAALCEARDAVASGEADCALAGGSDEATNPATLVYLRQAGIVREGELVADAGAYVVMERLSTAERDGKHVYARVARADLAAPGAGGADPLAATMGRSFAAAPSVLFALSAANAPCEMALCGVDRQEFRATLEAAP